MYILANTSDAASDIIQAGATSASAITEAMDQLWEEVLGGGLYQALVNLSLIFAIGSLVLFMVQWTQSAVSDESHKPFTDLIIPMLVIMLLANGGTLLQDVTLEMRGIINQTNQALLQNVSSSVSLQEAYQSVVGEVGAQSAIESLASNCANVSDPEAKQNCFSDAALQAQSIASSMEIPPSGGFNQFIDKIKDPVGTAQAAIASQVQIAITGWIIALGIAFQWVVEISLLLTALIAPIAVGLSLMPVQSKAIYGWLIGFFSVGMIKLYFNVIVGLIATMIVNAGENDPLIFAFATGLISPILAMALAAGGGIAIVSSIPKATQVATKGVSMIIPIPK